MAPLIALAVAIAAMLFRLLFDAVRVGDVWKRSLSGADSLRESLEKGIGQLGTEAAATSSRPVIDRFNEWRRVWVSDFQRRSRMIRILASATPLIGLLGTVTGMLKTFQGLSRSSVSDSMNLVAEGISEALVTTQAGLTFGAFAIVALYFVNNYGRRLSERLEIAGADFLLEEADR